MSRPTNANPSRSTRVGSVDLPTAPSSIDGPTPSSYRHGANTAAAVKKNSYNYYNGNRSPEEYTETKASMLRRRVTLNQRPRTPPDQKPEKKKQPFSTYPGRKKKATSIADLRGQMRNYPQQQQQASTSNKVSKKVRERES